MILYLIVTARGDSDVDTAIFLTVAMWEGEHLLELAVDRGNPEEMDLARGSGRDENRLLGLTQGSNLLNILIKTIAHIFPILCIIEANRPHISPNCNQLNISLILKLSNLNILSKVNETC